MTELWNLVRPTTASSVPRLAAALERRGWDGLFIPESQNLNVDMLVSMTLALGATDRLRVGSAVVNPFTRHPALVAGAFASLHELAPGRVVAGIGRGDSAVASIGLRPAGAAVLERFVRHVLGYLRGEAIGFADLEPYWPSGAMASEDPGETVSRLAWFDGEGRPPVWIAASGPRTIEFAARETDGVLLAVGVDQQRLEWAIDLARANGASRIAAVVNTVAHRDRGTAIEVARAMVSTFAHFSVQDGRVRGPIDLSSADQLREMHRYYDPRDHGRGGTGADTALSDDFVSGFGAVGTPGEVVDRLRALFAMGLDAVVVVGAHSPLRPDAAAEARATFVDEVLPAVRAV